MRKEIKTEEWKVSLLTPIFFGSILLIFAVSLLQSDNWNGWPYMIILGVFIIILTFIVFQRKTYIEEGGIVTWNNSERRGRTQDISMKKYIRWSEIKNINFEQEDRRNYVFGKNKKRGTIIIRTNAGKLELRFVLNPEEV